jgi:sec-independent protein translocase protein TatB
MFDIGFWELVIIGIIGLVVLGPERLPTAIRSVRAWVNKVKTFSNNVQTELKEELRVHELHENLKKAEQMNMENLSPELAESVKSLKEAANMVNRPFDTDKSLAEPENQMKVSDNSIANPGDKS